MTMRDDFSGARKNVESQRWEMVNQTDFVAGFLESVPQHRPPSRLWKETARVMSTRESVPRLTDVPERRFALKRRSACAFPMIASLWESKSYDGGSEHRVCGELGGARNINGGVGWGVSLGGRCGHSRVRSR